MDQEVPTVAALPVVPREAVLFGALHRPALSFNLIDCFVGWYGVTKAKDSLGRID
jgi:hypothetical protein